MTAKYGAHYLKGYFGFSLKEIAQKTGISQQGLSKVLKGKYRLSDKYEQLFISVFRDLKIEEKTKDFKESPTQLSMKESYQKVKNLLTIPLVSFIILSMATHYNISGVSSSRNKQNTNLFNRAFDFLLNAFFVFSNKSKKVFSLKPNF